jgi:protein-S-isoprenylcysteine O-methyltransferase Ste14
MRPGQAATGSVVFFFVTPGVVAGLLPWFIGRATEGATSWPMRSLGLVAGLVGLVALVACFADFVAARGTPAPVAPTERLVVEGLYRYVRNPMYVAVVTIILGQALWHGSWWVGSTRSRRFATVSARTTSPTDARSGRGSREPGRGRHLRSMVDRRRGSA